MQTQALGGMGGGSVTLTFDHILSQLQGELQKSREAGTELHNLSGAMHVTFGRSSVRFLFYFNYFFG